MKGQRLFNKNLKLLALVLSFALYALSLLVPVPVKAQEVINPSLWQTGATGLRTASNPDRKTAGLSLTVNASSIPFLSLQGGVFDAGWSKLGSSSRGTDLGEIKIPGTSPSFQDESADWSHNEMTFSQNLKIWISRLTPALLIQNTNTTSPLNSLRLFSGNLRGATISSDQWTPVIVTNRTAAPSYPKYVAFSLGGAIQVRLIPDSGVAALSLPVLDNNWILVWYGTNSYFTDTHAPVSYGGLQEYTKNILSQLEAYQADAPILLKFQNNPSSIKQTTEGGIDLSFSENSGYATLMPLLGREHPKASDTEGWSSSLPQNIIDKINFWVTGNRLCSYPTQVSETYAYDASSDTASITDNITYLNVCAGVSTNQGFAVIPPSLSLAKDSFGTNFSLTGALIDASYPTEFGPVQGIDNASSYTWSLSGLKKYTNSKRVLTNTGNAPADLVDKLTSEIEKTVQAGHFQPWIYPQHLPLNDNTDDIYYLNEADIIYQLSEAVQALPDSSDPQDPKNRLLEYIRSERTNPSYNPETVYNLPSTGASRTPNAINPLDPSFWDYGLNAFQSLQNRNKQLFLKRVPLYNFYALAKYYELPGMGAVPNSVTTAAKNALNRDMAQQDWATSSWFRGFNIGFWTGHTTLIDVNRLLDGLIGFTKLAKATGDSQEGLGRALLAKTAVQRVAMARYPRYLYSSGLQTLPFDPDWMPKYSAREWHGYTWNYNWTNSYDDPRQVAVQDQFGTYLSDSSAFEPPYPLIDVRDYEYMVNGYLSAYKDMVPETLRLVSDFAKQDLEVNLNKVTKLMPHWYMPYIEDFIGGEHGTTYPVNSYQLFMAKALVQKDTPENLKKYASFSWIDSGDFFYMQKLAETIKAYQGWRWEDEDIGVGIPGDVNSDNQVDVLDVQACVNHILGIQISGSRADVNQDGSVDVLDVQVIVNIILGV